MTSNGTVVGVDACPHGWCATILSADSVRTEVFGGFETLHQRYAEAARILVDIPIGLPTKHRRRCDEQAKARLGCRGLSVFYPPCEAVLEIDDYDEANTTHKEQIGHGLSRQAYSLREKISEVRDVVGDEFDGVVRESHPELCFYALNGQPIAYAKSSDRGRNLRRALLEDEVRAVERVYRAVRQEYPLTKVRRDDILDSIVLAVAARMGAAKTVPEAPDEGEPRIYYPDPVKLHD